MLLMPIRLILSVAEQVDQRNRLAGLQPRGERLVREVVYRDHGAVFPFATMRQQARVARVKQLEAANAKFRALAPRHTHALDAAHERAIIASLRGDVDTLVTEFPSGDDRANELFGVGGREAAVLVGGPLHRRA